MPFFIIITGFVLRMGILFANWIGHASGFLWFAIRFILSYFFLICFIIRQRIVVCQDRVRVPPTQFRHQSRPQVRIRS
jgi:hypothetical protein